MPTNIAFVFGIIVAALFVQATIAMKIVSNVSNSSSATIAEFKCLGASSKCYKVVSGSLNQQKAEEACHGMGGSLASIHSTEENDFLLSLIKGQKGAFWIGLKLQRHTEGDKKIISASWTDGSPLTYGNPLNLPISTKPWGPYQPDNNSITPGPELCVNMYQNGWHDAGCQQESAPSTKHGYICQKPGRANRAKLFKNMEEKEQE